MKRSLFLAIIAVLLMTGASSAWAHHTTGAKFYDTNKNGLWDSGEAPIANWELKLTRLSDGEVRTQYTGADGKTIFFSLIAGQQYKIEEVLQPGWIPTTPTSFTYNQVGEESHYFQFGNYYAPPPPEPEVVCFKTKGFWHNKNGLALLTNADVDYVNGLGPYDFPYDFTFKGAISSFLVEDNSEEGDPCKLQLLQQLLAFIFNVRHIAGGTDVIIEFLGEDLTAAEIIDIALEVWDTGSAQVDGLTVDCEDIIGALDALNNDCELEILVPAEN